MPDTFTKPDRFAMSKLIAVQCTRLFYDACMNTLPAPDFYMPHEVNKGGRPPKYGVAISQRGRTVIARLRRNGKSEAHIRTAIEQGLIR